MRTVIQAVSQAEVKVRGESVGKIGRGFLVLAAFKPGDDSSVTKKMAHKIAKLRIFPDKEGKMNEDISQAEGSVLVVSQFTLYGDAIGSNRPSFSLSAPAEEAKVLYEQFVRDLKDEGLAVETGRFQEMMSVSLINEGPTTIIIDL